MLNHFMRWLVPLEFHKGSSTSVHAEPLHESNSLSHLSSAFKTKLWIEQNDFFSSFLPERNECCGDECRRAVRQCVQQPGQDEQHDHLALQRG